MVVIIVVLSYFGIKRNGFSNIYLKAKVVVSTKRRVFNFKIYSKTHPLPD
jgi:hypothetical protein